jgi:Holliday junction resolvase RusA-like endonuclease
VDYFDIPIDPIGAPRMTQRDAWKKRPVVLRYFAYRDVVRLICNTEGYSPGGEIQIEFHVPLTKGRSKQKDLIGKGHDQKPDIDNMLKAFMDCFGEDKTVWKINAKKVWGETGFIRVFRQPS